MSLLFVGTTGMLADATRHLARSSSGDIAVVSRGADGFSFGDEALDQRATAYPADWSDQRAFMSVLDDIVAAHGSITCALVWLHGRDDEVRAQITHQMADGGTLLEVLGSAASQPGAFGDIRMREMRAHPHIRYRQALLGFVHEDGRSRWLTHDEISAGAIAAYASDETITVVGQTEPWSLRP